MTDEQRPWQDTDEYRGFLYAAGDPSPLAFWTEERDAALTALLARVWREAEKQRADINVEGMRELLNELQAERARADAAEAQRDRLAAALEQYGFRDRAGLDDWHDSYCPHWDRRACRERCAKSRAALADVRDDRARRRDEAYRAMVDGLTKAVAALERWHVWAREGHSHNVSYEFELDTACAALALARQVEE